jgi:hypothetical protein
MGNESLTVEEIRQLAGDVDDFLHKIALTYRCDYTQMSATILARLVRLGMDSFNEEGLEMLLESAQNTLRKSKRNPDNMH